MGFKSLSLQMFPWFFQFSCVHLRSASDKHPQVRTIKLIKSDGVVKIYHRPINVSELMHEFPKHLVCHSDSFLIGQKIPPLSETEELQLGHNYFLLPKHLFQSVLSFVTIAAFATKAPSPSPSNKNAAFIKNAFVIRKTPSGSLQIRVSDEFISNLIQQSKMEESDGDADADADQEAPLTSRICSTAQLQKDYTQLVVLAKQWKPKLETIKETKRKKRIASFGIKARKKSELNSSTKIKGKKKGL